VSLFIDLTGLPDDADPEEFYRHLRYRHWIKLQRELARAHLDELVAAAEARLGWTR
jgi:hypothetical protein